MDSGKFKEIKEGMADEFKGTFGSPMKNEECLGNSSEYKEQLGLARPKKSLRIALVSDFFYPKFGGVETHMFVLAQNLIRKGHKVIIITHAYGDQKNRQGVRILSNGLKTFYCAWQGLVQSVSYPAFFIYFPLVRNILIREGIEICHFHAVTPPLSALMWPQWAKLSWKLDCMA